MEKNVSLPLCECGCGKQVSRIANRFVQGHNKNRLGIPSWNKGIPWSDETKSKMSLSRKGKSTGRHIIHSEETKNKIKNKLKGMKGWERTEESRRNLSNAMKGQTRTKERRENIAKGMAMRWKDQDYVRKQMQSRSVAQNKTEKYLGDLLDLLFPNEWKFVGDGQVIIAGKNPDFININGQKKIIELFGDYWHQGEDPKDRIAIFTPYGYKTLVIWEHELSGGEDLISKLNCFWSL